MIVAAWNLCEVTKKETLHLTTLQFETKLEEDLNSLYLATLEEVGQDLLTFISNHFDKTLVSQFEMYSLSNGVLATAIQLTKAQQDQVHGTNLNYFASYAMKKITEVKIVCLQQRNKFLESSPGKKQKFQSSPPSGSSEGEKKRDMTMAMAMQVPVVYDKALLQTELENVFQEYFCCLEMTKTPTTRRSIRHCYRLKDSSEAQDCDREKEISEEMPHPCCPSSQELCFLFTTKFCDLDFLSPKELLQQQQQLTPASERRSDAIFSTFCGTICRLIARLVSVVDKYLLLVTSRSESCAQQDLTLLEHLSVMILNIKQFISSLQFWFQKILLSSSPLAPPTPSLAPVPSPVPTSGVSSPSINLETIGRIKIEFNKLYLEIQLSLLCYDSFLQDHSPFLRNSTKPSSLILEAFEFRLIATRTIIRLLSSTLKPNPMILFPSFPIESRVLSLIREFLQRFHFSYALPQSFLDDLLCRVDWYDHPETIIVLKKHISTEFGYVFDQLLQKFHRRVAEEEILLQSNLKVVKEDQQGESSLLVAL